MSRPTTSNGLTTSHGHTTGDLVWVGEPGPLDRKVVWRIASIYKAAPDKVYAVLTSGMTERSSTVPIERLTPYQARVLEPAQ